MSACKPDSEAPTGRRALPFYPLLVAAFPILALYARNAGEVTLQQVARPLGLSLLAAAAVWGVAGLLARDVRKGAAAASVVTLAFFTYGHALNLAPAALRPLVGPGLAAAALVVVLVIVRRRRLDGATAVLNLASVVLVAPACWTIAVSLAASPPADALSAEEVGAPWGAGAARQARSDPGRGRRPPPPPASGDLPDIYFIVLDAYGRDDILRQFYGYDNAPFLRALERRGFTVARAARSNYDQTRLSLASTLSMDYLDGVARRMGTRARNTEPLRRMIDESAVAATLRKRGYHYVSVSTGADQTRVETADLVLDDKPRVSAFEGRALGLTALDATPGARRSEHEQHRETIRAAFRNLQAVARLPTPKFVLAHILAPHPPFVFGPNGEAVHDDRPFTFDDGSWLLRDITRDQYRADYVAQLRYVNARVLEAIDAILKQSRRRPVIVLQGDHGPRMHLDWGRLARTDVREPWAILSACLAPRRVRRRLYDGITPVNQFRVLLSGLFGARLPLLPDRSFYCTVDRPYDLVEVTDPAQRPSRAPRIASHPGRAAPPAPAPAARAGSPVRRASRGRAGPTSRAAGRTAGRSR